MTDSYDPAFTGGETLLVPVGNPTVPAVGMIVHAAGESGWLACVVEVVAGNRVRVRWRGDTWTDPRVHTIAFER
jgi:hypothetical protein